MFFQQKDAKKGKEPGKPGKKVHYVYGHYKIQVAD